MRSLIALVLLTTPVWGGELPSSEGALPPRPSTPERSEMLRKHPPGLTFNYEQCLRTPGLTRDHCRHAQHCLTTGSTTGECARLYGPEEGPATAIVRPPKPTFDFKQCLETPGKTEQACRDAALATLNKGRRP